MSLVNTFNNTYPIESATSIVNNITLTYSGVITQTEPSFYVRNGDMITLFLPSITNTSATDDNENYITIYVPDEIKPANETNIFGFSINDSDGTSNGQLHVQMNSNYMNLSKIDSTFTTIPFESGNVSITRSRYISYNTLPLTTIGISISISKPPITTQPVIIIN